MRNTRSNFLSRLVAILLAFQLLAGLPVCQGWEGDADRHEAGGAVQEEPASHAPDGGAAEGHDHAGHDHHECPQTFLSPTRKAMPVRAAQGLVSAVAAENTPSPTYDIPPPIPIV